MTLKQVIRPFVTMAFCQQLICILRLLEKSMQKEVSVKEFLQQSCFHVFLYHSIFLDLNTIPIYSFIYITAEENGQTYPKEILYAFLKMKMFAFLESQNPFQKWCVNLLGNASELLVFRPIHDWKWVKWVVFSVLPLIKVLQGFVVTMHEGTGSFNHEAVRPRDLMYCLTILSLSSLIPLPFDRACHTGSHSGVTNLMPYL